MEIWSILSFPLYSGVKNYFQMNYEWKGTASLSTHFIRVFVFKSRNYEAVKILHSA